ncbi:hypothetical protein [Streptomyces chattanoogensis]|uniref:Uncharacterized protein n=1 Tax=Streptomyces chattanoogensis TaxID=66876 RepID=A0A0N0GXG8_9ACTN|nr:hypothetical protein [Streptomyces chattanoogensis]KPC60942.1 hypothetical protein ADL29_27025 [Streptomyces chattanoogensis]
MSHTGRTGHTDRADHTGRRDTVETLLSAAAAVAGINGLAGFCALDDAGALGGLGCFDAVPDVELEVRCGTQAAAGPGAAGHGPRPDRGAPSAYPSARDEATHELELACALVVNAAAAAASLERLVDDHHIDPEGALVFACLLHITGRFDAAQFWWHFGAGAGSRTAAYCLYLSHRRNGEHRDADYWRGQAAHAPDEERPTVAAFDEKQLLPDAARHNLLVQWHSGLAPTLPTALENVINRLVVDSNDEDFGEIPRPSPTLVRDLGRAN